MFSVALIGSDGAGKSTIAGMLAESFPLTVKVLYMGINLESSNVMLPTSRLIRRLKKMDGKKSGPRQMLPPAARQAPKSPACVPLARLVNRLAEEWYRQALVWKYERDGCDRNLRPPLPIRF